jgi:hypothetical protein
MGSRYATQEDLLWVFVGLLVFSTLAIGSVAWLVGEVLKHQKWIFQCIKDIHRALETPPKITLNIKGSVSTQPDADNARFVSYSDREKSFYRAEDVLMGQLWSEEESKKLIDIIKLGTLKETI